MPTLMEIELRAQLARRDERILDLEKQFEGALRATRTSAAHIDRLKISNERIQELEKLRDELLASQWQQREELAKRKLDELAELMGDQPACPECGGSHIVAELPMDGGAIQYQPCTRCCGTGEIHKTQINELTYVCIRCGGDGKEPT